MSWPLRYAYEDAYIPAVPPPIPSTNYWHLFRNRHQVESPNNHHQQTLNLFEPAPVYLYDEGEQLDWTQGMPGEKLNANKRGPAVETLPFGV